ncbi:zinc finger protein Xfin [Drosophila subobscura]|uniref:zinc finger protein Xfin n=1 Tax=Drosophila subobscura TaxID=7241 RepID=UPI00155A6BCA|nr:zinc finger protein Xfin [Drosophila subobscura]
MLPSNICRTCAVQNNNLLPLSTSLDKHTNKSFYDALQELTQIDPLLEHADDNLPQHLCADCLDRLENAYAFVEQARKVNGELLVRLRECLEESPIDIPQRQIKTEIDIDEEQRDFTDSGDPQRSSDVDLESAGVCSVEFKWTPESDALSNDEDEDVDKQQSYTLRRSSRIVKQQPDSEEEEGEGGNPSPNKRRRGRPPGLAKSQSRNSEGRHVCEVCGKTFSWYRDMKRHARIHYEKASFVCDTCGKGFLRKDKYMFHLRSHEKREAKCQALQLKNVWRYAERLYNSGRLKRMQCKLCGLKCQRMQELRSHLESHTRTDSLFSLRADSDVVKEHFARVPLELEKIKEQVCSEIAAGLLEKYSCVVNFHGYELCLSDSDDEPAGGEPPYHCDLCNLSFTRKYRLMRHTLEEHSQSPIAQRCSLCKVGFVCAKLFKQHQRTQCQSKVKRYRCRKCPGKFMWLENLERHACSHRREEQSYRQIICCLCDAQLPSLRQLRTHLATHGHGLSGIDPEQRSAFFRSYYPNGLSCSLSELSSRIAADYEAQDFGRYYNACTGSGQELDLFDSDTDESDADKTEGKPKPSHTCLLCGETADRLLKLLQHQRRLHSEEGTTYPCSCEGCGAGFVSDPLLQQHRRRSCAKKHSNYNCQRCNLHFVWQSNYEQHLRLYHNKQEQDQEQSEDCQQAIHKHKSPPAKLQCDECEKVFIWHKDLTRHKRMHRPTSAAQFECAFCDRKFHRKDGLKSHMRVHNEQEQEAAVSEEQPSTNSIQRMPREKLSQLCRPNGCKLIQCMICLSRHSKIADLRTHLGGHQYGVSFTQERDIASASRSLYPELSTAMEQQELVERIMSDVASGVELERFISITNEAGIELSLESSETETDSEQEDDESCEEADQQRYVCNICQLEVRRKHQLYAHQLEQHQWEDALLECAHCQARFVSEALLEHHYRSLCRNPQKRFQCRKCPLRFRWRENLKLHVSTSHQQKELPPAGEEPRIQSEFELQCGECKRSFKMQKDLTRHTLMHAQESSIYRCRWCARRFYRKANLLQHIERHGIGASQLSYAEALLDAYGHANGQKCVECKVCSLSFPSIAALRIHLGSHHELTSLQNYSITNQLGFELDLNDSETDEGESKPAGTPAFYTCGMCQLRCVRKYELHQHQQAMHRLEKIPDGCDRCIFKSVSPDLIAHHKRVQCHNQEKQFTCANCGYKFMWESNLLLHMQLQHGKTEEQEQDPPREETAEQKTVCQIFQCGLCPRKYNRKDRLTAHVKKFHNPVVGAPSATRPPIRPASPKEPKRFLCAFCGKAVSSSSNLIIHMRRHTGEKPFKCDYCEMAFPRSSDLQCHRRTHTGERPHICTVCQKGFARSYKLQQHMRIHNGERPYKCTYCEKSFTQSNDLTLHIRRHTGERPYQCGVCGERFIQGTALKNHRLQQGHCDEASQEGAESSRRTVLEQFTV